MKQLSGVDLLEEPVPVQPAMSRLLGGVAIDFNGETSIPGLLAAGECASNGFHGAGGLDGNYVLFSVASGKRAGRSAARLAASVSEVTPTSETLQRETAAVQGALSREGGAPVAASAPGAQRTDAREGRPKPGRRRAERGVAASGSDERGLRETGSRLHGQRLQFRPRAVPRAGLAAGRGRGHRRERSGANREPGACMCVPTIRRRTAVRWNVWRLGARTPALT